MALQDWKDWRDELSRMNAESNVLVEVRKEMDAQNQRWGVQDHPVLPVGQEKTVAAFYSYEATRYKQINDVRSKHSWDAILLEEVYEALSELDVEAREKELIQVAAVALQMVLCSWRARLAPYVESIRDTVDWVFAAEDFPQRFVTGHSAAGSPNRYFGRLEGLPPVETEQPADDMAA